jgi:hypothetical protein
LVNWAGSRETSTAQVKKEAFPYLILSVGIVPGQATISEGPAREGRPALGLAEQWQAEIAAQAQVAIRPHRNYGAVAGAVTRILNITSPACFPRRAGLPGGPEHDEPALRATEPVQRHRVACMPDDDTDDLAAKIRATPRYLDHRLMVCRQPSAGRRRGCHRGGWKGKKQEKERVSFCEQKEAKKLY